MFITNTDLAEGIRRAVGKITCLATTPGPILPQLIQGGEKVLVAFYEGDIAENGGADFDEERGDGNVRLLFPGMPGFALPPSWRPDWDGQSIYAHVPLWLLQHPRGQSGELVTLGIGAVHPRWNSATISWYDPSSRKPLGALYCCDIRQRRSKEQMQQEMREIEAAGGNLAPVPVRAPKHPGFF
jgi:hypothetical protein